MDTAPVGNSISTSWLFGSKLFHFRISPVFRSFTYSPNIGASFFIRPIQTPFAPFVEPKLRLAARLGLCWGARPSRWPFSASRRGRDGALRRPPARAFLSPAGRQKFRRPKTGMRQRGHRSAMSLPKRRQARHLCRIQNQNNLQPRRGGIVRICRSHGANDQAIYLTTNMPHLRC